MFKLTEKHTLTYQKLTLPAIALLLAFPVLPVLAASYIIAAVAVFLLAGIFIKSKSPQAYNFQRPWLLSVIYLVLIISLLYTSNFKEGIYALEKRAALVIFPLILFLRRDRINDRALRLFENLFIAIIFVFFIWVNGRLVYEINEYIKEGSVVKSWSGAMQNDLFSFFYRTRFEKISNIHPTYAGIFALFSSGILCVRMINGVYRNRKAKMIVLFLIFIQLVFGFFIAAKGPLLAFIVAFSIVAYVRLKRSRFYALAGGILILFVGSVVLIPPLKSRVMELFKVNKENEISSVSIRKIIYKTSWNLVQEEGLTGVGVGDVQDKLNEKYQKYDIEEVKNNELNTHNEYLNMWLSAGLAGVFAMIIVLGLPLFEAIKKKNANFVFFLTFMITVFLFENILSRQKGVLFFAVFYLIYYYHLIDKEECRQDIQNI